MRGKRALQWLWDWLGDGSMGENYEVLPSVQPVIEVNGIAMPVNFKTWVQTTNLVAGVATVQIGGGWTEDQKKNMRIWLNLTAARSNVAAGDSDSLFRQINVGATQRLYDNYSNLIPANLSVPVIGGMSRFTLPAGTMYTLKGRPPVVQTFESSLVYSATAAAAVGTFSLGGYYYEVPLNAVVPAEFLT